jgi:hypothetical protein
VIIPDNVAAFNSLLGGQTDWGLILATQIAEAEANGLTVISGLALNLAPPAVQPQPPVPQRRQCASGHLDGCGP